MSGPELELEKVVKGWALAITFFKRWQKDAVRTVGALSAKLRTDFGEPTDMRKRVGAGQAQLAPRADRHARPRLGLG